eukprot:TRINITY_DN1765_c2_g1_i1.p1 TRINITY_DN1765_c2_g1~~TRINITY_DN1765_c2_g1_i1.p1  ORF type:complete len:316 (-),score=56.60 TRINITY_DN1765_c2_g1_i1:165-1112(-)
MSWAIFSYTVLPAGTILVVLLLSRKKVAVKAAGQILSTPVEIGSLRLSVAVILTALCAALSVLSYSGLQSAEHRASQVMTSPLGQAPGMIDQQMRNVFLHGRNLYLSLLGLCLWAISWRLKCNADAVQLARTKQNVAKQGHSSIATKAFYIAIGIICLLLADIALCRLNYNMQLAMFVTPPKDQLLQSPAASLCHNAFEASAIEQCTDFCAKARQVSEERLKSILWARNWHIMGRLAAQVFDDARDVSQGPERINQLFSKKTCAQVLKSVDKSNQFVNAFCMVVTGVAIIGFLAAFCHVFDDEEEEESAGSKKEQ